MAPGVRVGLIGPSGAGKTTLLDVVAGRRRPDRGEVETLGRAWTDLRGRDGRRHRARIGAVTQHLDLALPLRVGSNVAAGRLGTTPTWRSLWRLVRTGDDTEVTEALGRVSLADRRLDRTDALSGGERQRVAVARVLHQRPDLVVADEPTSSVDPALADRVLGLLAGPDAPWTLIVGVHDPALAARHLDRLIGVRHGRVVFDRPAGDVNADELAALYG